MKNWHYFQEWYLMQPYKTETNDDNSWSVRQIEDSPELTLEGFKMFRVLEDSGFKNMGCEFVVIEPKKILDPHHHKKGHAIILVLSGHGFALINKKKYKIKKHSVLNIPPGVEHGLEAGDENLVVYGFQHPAIIDENNDADIYFTKDNRKGEVVID